LVGLATISHPLFLGFYQLVMWDIICVNNGVCCHVNCSAWVEGLLWVGFLGCLRVFCVKGLMFCVNMSICLMVLENGPSVEATATSVQHFGASNESKVCVMSIGDDIVGWSFGSGMYVSGLFSCFSQA